MQERLCDNTAVKVFEHAAVSVPFLSRRNASFRDWHTKAFIVLADPVVRFVVVVFVHPDPPVTVQLLQGPYIFEFQLFQEAVNGRIEPFHQTLAPGVVRLCMHGPYPKTFQSAGEIL